MRFGAVERVVRQRNQRDQIGSMVTTARVGPEPPRRAGSARGAGRGPGLLCVANFPSNTGYAWDFIESMFGSLADRFASDGVTTWVAYPRLSGAPRVLGGSAAVPVELEVRLDGPAGVARVVRFVRRHRIRALYLSDRAAWDPAYVVLRLAGVRWIVVHDHTSGRRTVPRGLKRLLKRARGVLRAGMADRVVAVSDFVARRKAEVDLVPEARIVRVWNTRPVPGPDATARGRLESLIPERFGGIVVCACRATPEKGVAHLFRAFDRYCASLPPGRVPPALVYFGDGPALGELRALRDRLSASSSIVLAGYRGDAADLLAGADVCVVPSVWEEAFGLAALEPMTRGVPVIASRVGGIPEVVVDGETGILVGPGDEAAIARALGRLLDDEAERERLGRNGLRRARTQFSPESALHDLVRVFEPAFPSDGVRK